MSNTASADTLADSPAVFLDYDTIGPGDIDPAPLARVLPALTVHGDTRPGERAARVADAVFVFTNKQRFGAAELDAAPALRFIGLTATGTDNVDLEAARARGIAVCNIRDYCTASVAQHAIAMLLSLTQQLPGYQRAVQAGRWSASEQFCLFDFPIRELAGRVFGVVGWGVLGQATARLAEALGMQVEIAARRDAEAIPAGRVAFEELLRRADVLSLHCPLTAATRELIGERELALMKPDAVLLNTARGGLVDGVALADALTRGRIGGAGIDVLDSEPPPQDHPLVTLGHDRLIVTPHVAWAAREARQRAIDETAANVAAFLAGERRNRVD
ncbi:MAG: D-2-hydroxyacid dehydrogenase [Gammaproteobacteria bacterium]|nr:MAG: D-2-hydroxyacid dehydrogenase [Gammaproteobacteria bacterium]